MFDGLFPPRRKKIHMIQNSNKNWVHTLTTITFFLYFQHSHNFYFILITTIHVEGMYNYLSMYLAFQVLGILDLEMIHWYYAAQGDDLHMSTAPDGNSLLFFAAAVYTW